MNSTEITIHWVESMKMLGEMMQEKQNQGTILKFPKTPECCETLPTSFRWIDEEENWHEARLKIN